MPNLLTVIVRDRKGIVWQGEATVVSSINSVGPFDVLQNHANFISIIKTRLLVTKIDKTKQEFNVDSGVMQVRENNVMIYLGVK
ncbi:MAG: hypothetical protein AAB697_03585 [Patescibacteria group bacterium]